MFDLRRLQDEDSRQSLAQEIVKWRRETIDGLVSALCRPDLSVSARATAVYLLGELRATTAVDHLVELLGQTLIEEKSPSYKAEAEEALIEVGRPAFDPLVKLLETSDDPARRLLATQVLYHLVGGKAPLKALLESLAEKHHGCDDDRYAALLAEVEQWSEDEYDET